MRIIKLIIVVLLLTHIGVSIHNANAATPAQAGVYHSSLSEQKCLADNMYWEARNQSLRGMIAVALVVRNRVNDERYPHSYCEVIQEGPTRPSWKDPLLSLFQLDIVVSSAGTAMVNQIIFLQRI